MSLLLMWFCYEFYREMQMDERRERAKAARKEKENFSDYFKKKMSDPAEMERMLLKAAEALKLPAEKVEEMRKELSKLSPEEKLDYVKTQLADDRMFQTFASVIDRDVNEIRKLKGALDPAKQEVDEDYLMDQKQSSNMRSEFNNDLAMRQAMGQIGNNFQFNF